MTLSLSQRASPPFNSSTYYCICYLVSVISERVLPNSPVGIIHHADCTDYSSQNNRCLSFSNVAASDHPSPVSPESSPSAVPNRIMIIPFAGFIGFIGSKRRQRLARECNGQPILRVVNSAPQRQDVVRRKVKQLAHSSHRTKEKDSTFVANNPEVERESILAAQNV